MRARQAGRQRLGELAETLVVTLGSRGCVAMQRGAEAVREPAVAGVEAVDSTGCGDCFAAGFLAGMIHGLPLRECARLGCLAGAAVVSERGAEVSAAGWAWARAKHAELGGGGAPWAVALGMGMGAQRAQAEPEVAVAAQ